MTDANASVFTDRRTDEQKTAGLSTQVLFWYDNPHGDTMQPSKHDRNASRGGRVRTSGIAVTNDGRLIVARVTCYIRDQFRKAKGRNEVETRILISSVFPTRVQPNTLVAVPNAATPDGFAAAYAALFPGDEMGLKRAYNVGKIFVRAQAPRA